MSWLFSKSRISLSKHFSYVNRSFVSKPNWSPLILSSSIHKNGLWHVPYFTEFFTCGQVFGLKIRTNQDKWRQTRLKWFLPSYPAPCQNDKTQIRSSSLLSASGNHELVVVLKRRTVPLRICLSLGVCTFECHNNCRDGLFESSYMLREHSG